MKAVFTVSAISRLVQEHADAIEALRLCVLNAETAAKYADGTAKDTLKVQNAPHWPGIEKARALLAEIDKGA